MCGVERLSQFAHCQQPGWRRVNHERSLPDFSVVLTTDDETGTYSGPGRVNHPRHHQRQVTRCLEGRFTQRVRLWLSWSELGCSPPSYSSMSVISSSFWHAAGTR